MIVLTLCNHKGGTGKTTSAVHLAAAMGLAGQRTLLVDLDPQGFLSRTLGFSEPPVEHSSLALFEPTLRLGDVPMRRLSGFDVLPSHMRMTHAMRKLDKPSDVLWAKDSIQSLQGYDVVLFDTAAALTVFSLNALVASTYCVIPVTPEHQPVVGAEQTFATVRMVQDKLNPALTDPLFLFTQVDARRSDHAALRATLRHHYGPCVMQRMIRTSAALSRTYPDGKTVFDYDTTARGSRDYANAAEELGRVIAQGGLRTQVRARPPAEHGQIDPHAGVTVASPAEVIADEV